MAKNVKHAEHATAEHEAAETAAELAADNIPETSGSAPSPVTSANVGDASAEPEAAEGSVQTHGVRARRALMLKQLLPNPDWINKNIVAGGKGTRGVIGRIYGIVTSTTRKTNVLPDGTPSESVACGGVLTSESYITGEISECSVAYFPAAYSEKIEALFKSDKDLKVVEVDVDIGLEATGKTIPYEWVIIAYREGAEMAVMKRLRASRGRPAQLLLTPPKD